MFIRVPSWDFWFELIPTSIEKLLGVVVVHGSPDPPNSVIYLNDWADLGDIFHIEQGLIESRLYLDEGIKYITGNEVIEGFPDDVIGEEYLRWVSSDELVCKFSVSNPTSEVAELEICGLLYKEDEWKVVDRACKTFRIPQKGCIRAEGEDTIILKFAEAGTHTLFLESNDDMVGPIIINIIKPESLWAEITCPVDFSITDPDGLIVSKQSNEIPGATYTETDINEDGDPDDIIIIPNRKIGNYQITVIPEPDAEPTDRYTLEVSTGDTTTLLAENVSVSEIPEEPYIFESTTRMCGDVNCDGKVTMSDVRKVFNRYLDPNYLLDLPWAADVNCDGKVSMSDVRKVFNRYLDPGYELNCCCEV
jgi:hypothetical protein